MLLLLQWDGMNYATKTFDFLKEFEGAEVWIFSKQEVDVLPETFEKVTVKKFPMPIWEKSLQNFLLTTLFFQLMENPNQYERYVIVSAHPYFEGTAFRLNQKGIPTSVIAYELSKPKKKQTKGITKNVRRKITYKGITKRDAEKMIDYIKKHFIPGNVYSVREFERVPGISTRKYNTELFGVRTSRPFMEMLVRNNCLEYTDNGKVRFIEPPTVNMILSIRQQRNTSRPISYRTSSNSTAPAKSSASTPQIESPNTLLDESDALSELDKTLEELNIEDFELEIEEEE